MLGVNTSEVNTWDIYQITKLGKSKGRGRVKDTKKFLVITSIFHPSTAVKKFSEISDWQLIVVGDKKTPADWRLDNAIYLSPEDQLKTGFEILDNLPWNHYGRKMVGYLYAMKHGAEYIADSDDDNEPMEGWPLLPISSDNIKTLSGAKFINIYKRYTNKFVWPRGYPLDRVLAEDNAGQENVSNSKVGIWQFLANGDPDVDAIYRLVKNEPITFDNSPPIILDEGTVCPFNSQNTVFMKEAFPLLFLPAFVTFRFTDILRGLVAQPVLWKHDMRLGFGPATVFQERNPHNYLKDFESEIPVYLHSERVIDIAVKKLGSVNNNSLTDNLLSVYTDLREENIVTDQELALLRAWIKDVSLLTGV
jgi:hypothetical protein